MQYYKSAIMVKLVFEISIFILGTYVAYRKQGYIQGEEVVY